MYSFHRQAQVFPDVLFASDRNGREIVLGIELKGWYLLAKEGMPNFRFQVTLRSCAVADLLVVMPWCLGNVLSGIPVVSKPYVVPARYAAEYRNYWWTEVRQTRTNSSITSPESVTPYPSKGEQIVDRPSSDSGNNFGRLARTGLMDDYIGEMLEMPLSGISVRDWLDFLRQFKQ